MPAVWREAPSSGRTVEPSALERWWKSFQDPLLDDLVMGAIRGNLDLKISAARIREARAARGIAASAALPQVDAAARAARISTPGRGERNVFEAGVDGGWGLDFFRRCRGRVAGAPPPVHAGGGGPPRNPP